MKLPWLRRWRGADPGTDGTDPGGVTPRRLVADGGDVPEDDEGPGGDGDGESANRDGGDSATGDGASDDAGAATPDDHAAATPDDHADGTGDEQDEDAGTLDQSDTEVVDAGEAEPADPKWEKPDLEDIPEFEVGGRGTVPESGGDTGTHEKPGQQGRDADDATAGMPNTARSPGDARIKREGTEGYVAALELCARLPDDVRLPSEAADLVPAAVEAELEQDVQSFAATEFDNPTPHVDVLEFVERDDEVWLRLRLGVPPEAFADLDPDAIRAHALEELEGLL